MHILKHVLLLSVTFTSLPVAGAATFETVSQLSGGYVTKIQFWDLKKGWRLSSGHISRTSDGGLTWKPIEPAGSSPVVDIGISNAGEGWADCLPGLNSAKSNRLFTYDYGNTWADGPARAAGSPGKAPHAAEIAIQLDGQILRFHRQTGVWSKISQLPLGAIDWQPRYASVVFSDVHNGLAAIDDLVFWTQDSGKTWHPVVFGPSCSDPGFFKSFDKSPPAIYVFGSSALLRFENGFQFYSRDRGRSWCSGKVDSSPNRKSGAQPIAPFAMVSQELGFMISRDQRLLQTFDGGHHWKILNTGRDEFFSAVFCTQEWCWVASDSRILRWRVE